MLPRKRLAGFVARSVVVYALLIVPWPGLQGAYNTVYVTAANILFGSFGADGTARFWTAPPATEDHFIRMTLSRRSSPVMFTSMHDPRLTGLVPTALVIALILATPAPAKRRWWSLCVGLLLVHGFIALRLLIGVIHGFSGDSPWCLFHPGPFWQRALDSTFEIGVAAPTLTFVVPVFIWMTAMAPTIGRNMLRSSADAPREPSIAD